MNFLRVLFLEQVRRDPRHSPRVAISKAKNCHFIVGNYRRLTSFKGLHFVDYIADLWDAHCP